MLVRALENTGEYSLIRYNLQNGGESCRVELTGRPDGVTLIVVGGKLCLALSYT